MKRLVSFLAVVSIVVAAVAVAKSGDEKAAAGHHAAMASAKTGTWTGEVLDAGCYIGHGAMGAKHAECGLKCAASGMPLMLLTKDAKAILLTPNHDNPDAYGQLKTMVGSMATVTGTLAERGGVRGIDVTGVTAVATTSEAK